MKKPRAFQRRWRLLAQARTRAGWNPAPLHAFIFMAEAKERENGRGGRPTTPAE
jgi:hypothetical protein